MQELAKPDEFGEAWHARMVAADRPQLQTQPQLEEVSPNPDSAQVETPNEPEKIEETAPAAKPKSRGFWG